MPNADHVTDKKTALVLPPQSSEASHIWIGQWKADFSTETNYVVRVPWKLMTTATICWAFTVCQALAMQLTHIVPWNVLLWGKDSSLPLPDEEMHERLGDLPTSKGQSRIFIFLSQPQSQVILTFKHYSQICHCKDGETPHMFSS